MTPPDPFDPSVPTADLLGDDLTEWDSLLVHDHEQSLVELINRVLDRGVVITGEITLSVAGVDLVYLGLNAVLTSVSTARRALGRRVGHLEDTEPGRPAG